MRRPGRGNGEATRRGTRQSARAAQVGARQRAASYPLGPDDLPQWADVVAAVIISSRPGGVRVSGIGQSSEPFAIGDRKLAAMPGLARASQQALAEAGIAATDCDVVEVDGLTLFDEAVALEATGFAAKGNGLTVLAGDRRMNPSGGECRRLLRASHGARANLSKQRCS